MLRPIKWWVLPMLACGCAWVRSRFAHLTALARGGSAGGIGTRDIALAPRSARGIRPRLRRGSNKGQSLGFLHHIPAAAPPTASGVTRLFSGFPRPRIYCGFGSAITAATTPLVGFDVLDPERIDLGQ